MLRCCDVSVERYCGVAVLSRCVVLIDDAELRSCVVVRFCGVAVLCRCVVLMLQSCGVAVL